jgi:hypothetical protein
MNTNSALGIAILVTAILAYLLGRRKAIVTLKSHANTIRGIGGSTKALECYQSIFYLSNFFFVPAKRFGFQDMDQVYTSALHSLSWSLARAKSANSELWDAMKITILEERVTTDEEKLNFMSRAGTSASIVSRLQQDIEMLKKMTPATLEKIQYGIHHETDVAV